MKYATVAKVKLFHQLNTLMWAVAVVQDAYQYIWTWIPLSKPTSHSKLKVMILIVLALLGI